MKSLKSLIVLGALLVLAACGGGGGSSTPTASTDIYQLRTAYVNSLTEARTSLFTVSGNVQGLRVTGNGSATEGALTNTTFESQAALQKVSVVSMTINANGQTAPSAGSATTYVDSNYNPLGSIDTDYEVVTGTATIPTTAKVNDAGLWYSSNLYSTASKTTRIGTASVSYALEPETASTAVLKIIRIEKDTSGIATFTQVVSFRMTPSGTLTKLSQTGARPDGTSLLFTF